MDWILIYFEMLVYGEESSSTGMSAGIYGDTSNHKRNVWIIQGCLNHQSRRLWDTVMIHICSKGGIVYRYQTFSKILYSKKIQKDGHIQPQLWSTMINMFSMFVSNVYAIQWANKWLPRGGLETTSMYSVATWQGKSQWTRHKPRSLF